LPVVRFHALRHTHASALIAAGLDVVKTSKRLGYANPTITLNIHAHLFNRTDTAAAAASEAVLRTRREQ
jgi:integrase